MNRWQAANDHNKADLRIPPTDVASDSALLDKEPDVKSACNRTAPGGARTPPQEC